MGLQVLLSLSSRFENKTVQKSYPFPITFKSLAQFPYEFGKANKSLGDFCPSGHMIPIIEKQRVIYCMTLNFLLFLKGMLLPLH